MIFEPLPISGGFLIELERLEDTRGFFARQFCAREFAERGLEFNLAQANVSFSAKRGTLRGMHYQVGEHAELKLVRCILGEVWDCVLDLRMDSETFGEWHAEKLTSENRRMMAIPRGCAHGFISLTPETELLYMVDKFYAPGFDHAVRWNDPYFSIEWPIPPQVVSARDESHPLYDSCCSFKGEGNTWYSVER